MNYKAIYAVTIVAVLALSCGEESKEDNAFAKAETSSSDFDFTAGQFADIKALQILIGIKHSIR